MILGRRPHRGPNDLQKYIRDRPMAYMASGSSKAVLRMPFFWRILVGCVKYLLNAVNIQFSAKNVNAGE